MKRQLDKADNYTDDATLPQIDRTRATPISQAAPIPVRASRSRARSFRE
jgi:hypothetical protein